MAVTVQLRFSAALLAFAAAPAAAQQPPGRESNVIVYGDDPCPQPQAEDEIVVCARRPEEERYRIPEPLRRAADRPPETSWSSQVAALEEAQRETRPDGCSVVGSFGQTGCTQDMLRRWRAERRALGGRR